MRSLLVALALTPLAFAQRPTGAGWPTYGGDAGGQRYSNAAQITRANVAGLHPVWTYHTHALESGNLSATKADFEATPILFDGTLYLSTPFALTGNYPSRGVAAWKSATGTEPCSTRIFVATLDARLIAVDAATGKP